MKKMKYLIWVILLGKCFSLKSQDLRIVENELCKLYSKIEYWNFGDGSKKELGRDSFYLAVANFDNQMQNYTTKYPKTLTHKFDSLSKRVEIKSSPDSNLRIYSWDNLISNTYVEYSNIFQYKTTKGITSVFLSEDSEFSTKGMYYDIDQVNVKGKVYYILFSYTKYGNGSFNYNVEAYTIKNKFLYKDSLFKAKSKMFIDLNYYVNLREHFQNATSEEDPNYEIQYDKKNKIISIPVIKENGLITNNRLKYKFNGTVFEYIAK